MKIFTDEISAVRPRYRRAELELEIHVHMQDYQAYDTLAEIWEQLGTDKLQKWFARENFELKDKKQEGGR